MPTDSIVYSTYGYLWPDNWIREQFLDIDSYTEVRYPAPDVGVIDEDSHTHYCDFCPETHESQISKDELIAFLEQK